MTCTERDGFSVDRAGLLLIAASLMTLGSGLGAAELAAVPGAARLRVGWRDAQVSPEPAERLARERRWRSRNPLYVAIRLGSDDDGVITAVLDESDGTGRGYDEICVDANNNGDLTDDTWLKPRVVRRRGGSILSADAVRLTVKYADGSQRELGAEIEVRGHTGRRGRRSVWSAGCTLVEHLEGRVDFGERKDVLLGIYDASSDEAESNGCFDDHCIDRLRIDLNGDGVLDPDREDCPLSKVLSLYGQLWVFDVDGAGRNVSARPCSLPTGDILLSFRTGDKATVDRGKVELASKEGYAFGWPLPQERPVAIPAAAYTIGNGRMVVSDASKRTWETRFSCGEPIRVAAGSEVALSFGAPFKVAPAVEGSLIPGGEASITPDLRGAAGEAHVDMSPAGRRMSPTVSIRDVEDIVVASGTMEYG